MEALNNFVDILRRQYDLNARAALGTKSGSRAPGSPSKSRRSRSTPLYA